VVFPSFLAAKQWPEEARQQYRVLICGRCVKKKKKLFTLLLGSSWSCFIFQRKKLSARLLQHEPQVRLACPQCSSKTIDGTSEKFFVIWHTSA